MRILKGMVEKRIKNKKKKQKTKRIKRRSKRRKVKKANKGKKRKNKSSRNKRGKKKLKILHWRQKLNQTLQRMDKMRGKMKRKRWILFPNQIATWIWSPTSTTTLFISIGPSLQLNLKWSFTLSKKPTLLHASSFCLKIPTPKSRSTIAALWWIPSNPCSLLKNWLKNNLKTEKLKRWNCWWTSLEKRNHKK